MPVFDVNAARAQRREALGVTTWSFRADDEVFTLPVELPRQVVRQLSALPEDDVDGLLRLLLGEEQYERFDRLQLTVQDVAAVLDAYGKETGLSVGEG
ncbi:hypothetical protein [Allostreptomyces psammosilenae]|uniref:CRISPR/Cas system CMR-associated protein Cmr3 (Group 5 of RAMP superfamily) n=1 Tax=Allostreptomyces psammosilenae TaxID=1892865 RepID=A0A852ZSD5_9ACTN|nr:hypothetical protein [Allostreptomyces psammosilenae]NYI05249.1 CRISPR/Cas system CMR-associated protein Cmr3 (group 5 of RAMP superfamily) [Allostreptomyces psammosilenae]